MSSDPNKKSGRTFQCRDVLWETFEQMARELECSVDYLINEAMKQYARQRSYGSRTPFPGQGPEIRRARRLARKRRPPRASRSRSRAVDTPRRRRPRCDRRGVVDCPRRRLASPSADASVESSRAAAGWRNGRAPRHDAADPPAARWHPDAADPFALGSAARAPQRPAAHPRGMPALSPQGANGFPRPRRTAPR